MPISNRDRDMLEYMLGKNVITLENWDEINCDAKKMESFFRKNATSLLRRMTDILAGRGLTGLAIGRNGFSLYLVMEVYPEAGDGFVGKPKEIFRDRVSAMNYINENDDKGLLTCLEYRMKSPKKEGVKND